MTKLLDAPKDAPKDGGASQSLELVLATLPILAKEDPKGKERISSTTDTTLHAKTAKDKLVIKMKP